MERGKWERNLKTLASMLCSEAPVAKHHCDATFHSPFYLRPRTASHSIFASDRGGAVTTRNTATILLEVLVCATCTDSPRAATQEAESWHALSAVLACVPHIALAATVDIPKRDAARD
jgi:hypothetical protein